MQETTSLFVGVDVAKVELVYAIANREGHGTVRNEAAAITRWLGELPSGSRIALESTGRYGQALARLAQAAGMVVYVLNARDVRRYRQSWGTRGKTDPIDARAIAQMLFERHAQWRPWVAGNAQQQAIDELLRRRACIATHRQAIEQSAGDLAELSAPLQAALAALSGLLVAIDRSIEDRVRGDPVLHQTYRRLCAITGFGPQTAAYLANLLNRIRFDKADALVAFSGLDPRPNDSGQRQGRRRLTKRGPAGLRRLLFLAAMGAARSRALKPLYLSIRAKGFSTTEALVILARKLLRVAFAVAQSDEPFDPKRLLPPPVGA